MTNFATICVVPVHTRTYTRMEHRGRLPPFVSTPEPDTCCPTIQGNYLKFSTNFSVKIEIPTCVLKYYVHSACELTTVLWDNRKDKLLTTMAVMHYLNCSISWLLLASFFSVTALSEESEALAFAWCSWFQFYLFQRNRSYLEHKSDCTILLSI